MPKLIAKLWYNLDPHNYALHPPGGRVVLHQYTYYLYISLHYHSPYSTTSHLLTHTPLLFPPCPTWIYSLSQTTHILFAEVQHDLYAVHFLVLSLHLAIIMYVPADWIDSCLHVPSCLHKASSCIWHKKWVAQHLDTSGLGQISSTDHALLPVTLFIIWYYIEPQACFWVQSTHYTYLWTCTCSIGIVEISITYVLVPCHLCCLFPSTGGNRKVWKTNSSTLGDWDSAQQELLRYICIMGMLVTTVESHCFFLHIVIIIFQELVSQEHVGPPT